ncbi:uncharacterized protein [Physcomitrium patens]|uniref:Bifunctional inhibitor/plant lipid transfer protein/seed storage helical domain-containing protein n=1 Tax=Physcomitrium patens TaxID=3218 RepID=A9T5W7_PHYPA|nr:uncharacterized protein LOC112295804 [Physcomitrium patens]XP_024403530.1 uncharacterized protein LOC112295804 [Physcomitrium patens]PNR34500.1 hypothetical protein PHYPA_024317 [Physcomitrium patens]|eukprot:XP_024403529.1 uncharacterized protein LOC112295804 [Physcomitrella patens]
MQTMRFFVMLTSAVTFLFVVDAQAPAATPNYNCTNIITKLTVPEKDPCTNTTAYANLGACSEFMNGTLDTPSSECCSSVDAVWSKSPACFCKVTFFSKFAEPGPERAILRPQLCNLNADLCSICPTYLIEKREHRFKRLNTASVVTVSVIVTLVVVGSIMLVRHIRKKVALKKTESSKTFVPHFNNV